jgi:uncharacterized protein (TIGR03086 family)
VSTGPADGLRVVPRVGPAAFEQALRYALAAATPVTPQLMTMPTPCRDWDLRTLLLHACESLTALAEGFDAGCINLQAGPGRADQGADPGVEFRRRARGMLGSSAGPGQIRTVITVGGCPVAGGLIATAGALEVAVHGWDISRACGGRDPIPAPLADWLLRAAPLLITAADRGLLFAPPVSVTARASPSDQLAAYLGRSPQLAGNPWRPGPGGPGASP